MKCISILCLTYPMFATTITSGSISISGPLPHREFTLNGLTFTATGNFSQGNWGPARCYPCSNFDLNVSAIQHGNDFGGGMARVSGIADPAVDWGNLNAVDASLFILTGPPIPINGPGIYVGTFMFDGDLCGYAIASGGVPLPCLVDLPGLEGAGVVRINIVPTPIQGIVQFESAVYIFFVPEPATGRWFVRRLQL